MTDPSLDPILAYLRQYSAQYSLPALREQLVQNGYDPATVDAAIAVHQQGGPQPAAAGGSSASKAGCRILLVIVAVIAVILLAAGGLCLYVLSHGNH
jgi:hypothetical protein